MAVSPDNQTHRELEAEVTEYLEGRGFSCASLTYHDHLPQAMQDRIRRLYTPASLYVRHRADRLAVHGLLPVVFEWEAKTHETKAGGLHDCCIDAIPFLGHVVLSRNLGVHCLFCYRDQGDGRDYDVGFWSHHRPALREFRLPPQREAQQEKYYRELIARHFPQTPLRACGTTAGSGDPFAVIDEAEVALLPNWRALVGERIGRVS